MDLEFKPKSDVPTLESVCANIARPKREIHSKIIVGIRNIVGNIQDLSDFQVYMKFKSVVMNLDYYFRPEESSWPMVLLEVFMPHLVDWPTHLRLEKINEFQDFIMKVENDLNANE